MTGSVMSLAAPAKVNLRLLVGRRRPDGYHPIESLMVALGGLEDTVELRRSSERQVVCPGVDERANLAWSALDALESAVGRALPCTVRIEKRIPAQAGLGGGSSDAAATLVAADRLFALDLGRRRLETIAAEVGSDVPFFIRGGVQWARGRGELLQPAQAPPFAAVVVKPPIGLSTADVYSAFDTLSPPQADEAPLPDTFDDLAGWARNDLRPAALECAPQLADLEGELLGAGARFVLLCGSGSAMAGLFPTREAASQGAHRLGRPATVVWGGGAGGFREPA